MGKFRELREFEQRFDSMEVGELQRWKAYWTDYAQHFTRSAREAALNRVFAIEKAIVQKVGIAMLEPTIALPRRNPARDSLGAVATQKTKASAGRIMYIERKAGGLTGPARIGRVAFSKTGRTLYYRAQRFKSLKGAGFKSNYYDVDSGDDYWISGPKRDGGDRLYGGRTPVEIDDDVQEEYWRDIRHQPKRICERFA